MPLLAKANVGAAVQAALEAHERRTEVDADRVLRNIDRAAYLHIARLFDAQGNLRPIHQLPEFVRRAIGSVEVIKTSVTAGAGTVEHVHKIKLIDRGRMHEMLGDTSGSSRATVRRSRRPSLRSRCRPTARRPLSERGASRSENRGSSVG